MTKQKSAERAWAMGSRRWSAVPLLLAGLLFSACGVETKTSGGNTNWLDPCQVDAECASGWCAAGTCAPVQDGATVAEAGVNATVTSMQPISPLSGSSALASDPDSGGMALGSAAVGSEPSDGGECSDITACISSDSAASTVIPVGSASSDAGAAASDASVSAGRDAVPNEGCALGNATPPLALEYFSRGTTITLPAGYDGTTPLPLVLALHASGGDREMDSNFPADHPLRQNFIVVTPNSELSTGGLESEPHEFDTFLRDLFDNYCFDTKRFYLVGHASGARIGYMLSGYVKPKYPFTAAALVGAIANGNAIPTLFIHATEDSYSDAFQDRDGSTVAARLAKNNGCGSSTRAFEVAGGEGGVGTDVADCVEYQGCSEALQWCRFVDPGTRPEYWPTFASDLIYDFLVQQG